MVPGGANIYQCPNTVTMIHLNVQWTGYRNNGRANWTPISNELWYTDYYHFQYTSCQHASLSALWPFSHQSWLFGIETSLKHLQFPRYHTTPQTKRKYSFPVLCHSTVNVSSDILLFSALVKRVHDLNSNELLLLLLLLLLLYYCIFHCILSYYWTFYYIVSWHIYMLGLLCIRYLTIQLFSSSAAACKYVNKVASS